MSKREFEDYEREGMIDAIRCRRDEPTQYVPPDRGDKILSCYAAGTIRGRGVPSEQVGSVISTLLWLIKHANPTTGRCDPGVTKLGRETGYSKSSVLRALDTIENLEWMERERRHGRSTAYHLFFDRMVADFRYVEEQTRNEVVPYATPPSAVRDTTPVSHATPYESVKESVEEKAYPEWAPSPSALDANEKQKGHSGKRVTHSVGGNSASSESAAKQRVNGHIDADAFVKNNPPSPDAYAEAVAAELGEVGSGKAIIQRAANDTWKARRSA